MKDIHSHLLVGIDDGSESFEESIKILKLMEKSGITDLIITPHYVENSKYNCNNKDKKELFKQLIEKKDENNININLYLGNEVFFTSNIIDLIKQGEIRTLNNTRYLLIEFPLHNIYNNTLEVIQRLVSKGVIPVLAHPERYEVFQNNPDIIKEYLRAGVLMQGNFTSLFGKYGPTPKKLLTYYLKNEWITFLGSDTHHEVKYDARKLEKMLLKITKDKYYVKYLMENNFDKVINDEDIGMVR